MCRCAGEKVGLRRRANIIYGLRESKAKREACFGPRSPIDTIASNLLKRNHLGDARAAAFQNSDPADVLAKRIYIHIFVKVRRAAIGSLVIDLRVPCFGLARVHDREQAR